MTIIELNIAGYHVTHNRPDFRGFKANWLHGWRGLHRRARSREHGAGTRAA
jgi:hypothetical protein